MFKLKEFKKFNRQITTTEDNKKGFDPYEYQSKVAEHLLNDKNVILSVPTGAGKTWASIMPFLYAQKANIHFPRKMIYSLPLRALCNSISEDVEKALKNTDFDGLSAIQTGEFSNDKYFESDIVFSTIDQTLSNFLCFPLPLSKRQANINAGALIGSYLVFDEFHLLDGSQSMATTLGMLRMLGKLSRFCIMTATLSDDFMDKLRGTLDNVEIVTLDGFDSDKAKIGSLKPKDGKVYKKEIEVAKGIINADKIIENHVDKTIVICNRVETAQRVYLELESWARANDVNLICLHSRFFDRHRKEYEKKLKKFFGKDVKDIKTNSILISTQVIEAGMDISCEVMHTEVAPINALLQRVGRCARYEGEYGKVFVYDVLDEEQRNQLEKHSLISENDFKQLSFDDKKEIRKLNNLYLPYHSELCTATLKELRKTENQKLNEEVTIRLVNEILRKEEETLFERIKSGNKNEIIESWKKCEKSAYRKLIRDIQNANAILIDNKNMAERFPYSMEDIGMFKWSLVKWIKEILETVDTEENWVVGVLDENPFLGGDGDEIKLLFREIRNIDGVIETYDTLYLNANYFHYDEHIGFNKYTGELMSKRKERKNREKEIFVYRKDTFIQHTKGLLGAFEKDFLYSVDFTFKAFQEIFNCDIEFRELVHLMLILHDYGKLDHKWQEWMQEYQDALSRDKNLDNAFKSKGLKENIYTYEEGIPLGHTGFNKREERALFDEDLDKATKAVEDRIFKKRGKRPPHSGVGANEIITLLNKKYEDENMYDNIILPTAYAIARHHGISNHTYPTYNISEHNYQFIKQLLNQFDWKEIDLERNNEEHESERFLDTLEYSVPNHILMYLFMVRILRLCDQKATEDFEEYLKFIETTNCGEKFQPTVETAG